MSMDQTSLQTNETQTLTFQTGKSFSENISCLLALLNIIHSLECSGSSQPPTSQIGCFWYLLFSFLTLHFYCAIGFPSPDNLLDTTSSQQMSTGNQKNTTCKRQTKSSRIIVCPCGKGTLEPIRPPKFAFSVRFSELTNEEVCGICCAQQLKQNSRKVGG